MRLIELPGCTVRVAEDSSQADEAGVVVWDAGLVLVHYLRLAGDLVKGRRVIDLGCGTGVAGLCAAALGAASVTLTDLPHLLPLAQRNIELNNLGGVVSTEALCWGEPLQHLGPPLDVVLASDVIYQAAVLPALLSTLRGLAGPSTLVLLSAEHRQQLPFPREDLEAVGFAVQQVPHCDLHPDWRSEDIAVFQLRLRPGA